MKENDVLLFNGETGIFGKRNTKYAPVLVPISCRVVFKSISTDSELPIVVKEKKNDN